MEYRFEKAEYGARPASRAGDRGCGIQFQNKLDRWLHCTALARHARTLRDWLTGSAQQILAKVYSCYLACSVAARRRTQDIISAVTFQKNIVYRGLVLLSCLSRLCRRLCRLVGTSSSFAVSNPIGRISTAVQCEVYCILCMLLRKERKQP